MFNGLIVNSRHSSRMREREIRQKSINYQVIEQNGFKFSIRTDPNKITMQVVRILQCIFLFCYIKFLQTHKKSPAQ